MGQESSWQLDWNGIQSINHIQKYTNHNNNNNNNTHFNITDEKSTIYLQTQLFDSSSVILLIILYSIVVFGGVFGNISLVITLCTQNSPRIRNPLLVALCLADILVTGVSAPLTIIALAMAHKTSSMASFSCKTINFMQSMPVAASTISLLMLSLDRYATVKHPRLAQLRQRRCLPIVLAFGAWLSAIIICSPLLLVYRLTSYEIDNHIITELCLPDYGTTKLHITFIVIYTIFVFLIPGLGVLLNHLGVRKRLCALSLTARAAHGELPLPMPILRRPTHMIIVTGMANAACGGVDDDSSNNNDDDDENENENNCNDKNMIMMMVMTSTKNENGQQQHNEGEQQDQNQQKNEQSQPLQQQQQQQQQQQKQKINEQQQIQTRMRVIPRTPRQMRQQHIHKQHKQKKQEECQSSGGLPLPQTSTLRSRRRLANLLVGAAIIFVCCWSPHVICLLCFELGATNVCPKTLSEFSLLLGYAHSALNPILYWILNHNSLRQSTCAPILRLSSVQKFLRTHLRVPAPPPPPSSTNEAALGPFNPRYIKSRPAQQYRAPPSSHYLY